MFAFVLHSPSSLFEDSFFAIIWLMQMFEFHVIFFYWVLFFMVSLVNSFLALHLSIVSLRATILYPVTLASRSLNFLFCLLPFLVPGLPSFFLSLKISLHNLLGSVRSSFLVSSFVSFLLRVSFYDLPVVAYWFSVCLFLLSSHLFALYADRRSWWYLFCFL